MPMDATNQKIMLIDLERVAQTRQEFADYLCKMAEIIEVAENQAQAQLEVQQATKSPGQNATNLKFGRSKVHV